MNVLIKLGIFVGIAAGIVLVGAGLWWVITSHDDMCDQWKQTVLSVGRNDPQDLSRVIEMYKENC